MSGVERVRALRIRVEVTPWVADEVAELRASTARSGQPVLTRSDASAADAFLSALTEKNPHPIEVRSERPRNLGGGLGRSHSRQRLGQRGVGFVGSRRPLCAGPDQHHDGRVLRQRTVDAKIPAGVETGSRLRLQAEGESGVQGGPPGDLYVVIHVAEHEEFERQGNNLYASIPITFAQAALGSEINVKTLNEDQSLKIPAGTQTGTVFRVRGQGMPVLGGRGKGDLFVSVSVITPTSLTREQRKLLEQLAKIETQDLEDKRLVDKVRDIFG